MHFRNKVNASSALAGQTEKQRFAYKKVLCLSKLACDMGKKLIFPKGNFLNEGKQIAKAELCIKCEAAEHFSERESSNNYIDAKFDLSNFNKQFLKFGSFCYLIYFIS